MPDTLNKAAYSAFGYAIRSELPFPELPRMEAAGDGDAAPDEIAIRIADLAVLWSELEGPSRKLIVNENLVMFDIPDTAIFAVREGRFIDVSPASEADGDRIRLYILGTCMGALLLQRKVLPLHGSAIVVDGAAYAIVGDSGSGKSTLASYMLEQGHRLLSDDVIAVRAGDGGKPWVMPAYPQQKLWQESLDAFGMEASRYRPLHRREAKYAIPVHDRFAREKLPLAGIFELAKTDCEAPRLLAVPKLERLHLLHRHTYRNFLLTDSGLARWHLQTTAGFAGKVGVCRLLRPSRGFTAPELSSLLLSAIERKEQG